MDALQNVHLHPIEAMERRIGIRGEILKGHVVSAMVAWCVR